MSDTFTAGVAPGGLNSNFEIKVLLCYLMQQIPSPLPHDDLIQALTSRGLANYFEVADSLSQLLAAGLIEQNERGYTVTTTGLQIADTLGKDLPFTVRERAVEEVEYRIERARKMQQHTADINETDNGFEVVCTIKDEVAGPLFSLTVYTPSRKSASVVRENFIEKAESILRYNLTELTGENFTQ